MHDVESIILIWFHSDWHTSCVNASEFGTGGPEGSLNFFTLQEPRRTQTHTNIVQDIVLCELSICFTPV